MFIRPRSALDTKNFVPPSRVLKIVPEAELDSDTSWSESDSEGPQTILRDGKPGQKYILRKKKRERRSSDSSDDSTDDEMILTRQYLKKPQTPVALMDAKDDHSSGENYDEFGRLRKRYKRPESAVEEVLPPMVQDPSDNGNAESTRSRLQMDAVVIREELVKEEGIRLLQLIAIFSIENKCDNCYGSSFYKTVIFNFLWSSSIAVRALAYCAEDHGSGPP